MWKQLQPNEVAITPYLMAKIAESNTANIDGRTFTFAWGEAEVLMWSSGTDIVCPMCRKECKRCLVLKTDTGDVFACINCNKFVMYADDEKEINGDEINE